MVAWNKDRDGNLNVILRNKQYQVSHTDGSYTAIWEGLSQGKSEDEILAMVDRTIAINDLFIQDKDLLIKDGVITYKGFTIEHAIIDNILAMAQQKLPVMPLLKLFRPTK